MTTSTTATPTHSQRQRERAGERAARQLLRHGIHPGPRWLLSPEATCWLADVAAFVRSLDPVVIGAAAILESSGYQRTAVQLTLEL
jgi:hypothetical protein